MRFSPLPPALKLYKIKYTYTDIYTYMCAHIYIYVLFPDVLQSYKSEGNYVFFCDSERNNVKTRLRTIVSLHPLLTSSRHCYVQCHQPNAGEHNARKEKQLMFPKGSSVDAS